MSTATAATAPRRRAGRRKLVAILWTALREWWQGDSLRVGAALAYYSVFSLAPMLVIAIAIGGLFFGDEAARGSVLRQFNQLLGREGAVMVQEAIESASLQPKSSIVATLIALVTLM